MSDEKSDKLAKLRNRVQEKLVGSRLKSRRLKKDTEEDIVIKVEKTEEPEIKELPLILDEAENRRSLASTLVLIGSIMGIVSGVLILQGNPSDLLTSNLFSDTEALDIHGSILDIEGNVVQDVTIELIDPDTEVVIKTTLSDDNLSLIHI